MREKVTIIWTDPSTNITHESEVDFDVRLDFNKMKDVILSF